MKWYQYAYGFGLLIAVCSAAKLPDKDSTYPDTLYFYLAAMTLTAVGLFFWRFEQKRLNTEVDNGSSNVAVDLVKNLNDAQQELLRLKGEESQEIATILDVIDTVFEKYLQPILEDKQNMTSRYGMLRASENLAAIADSERILNRIWTIAADGYPDQALGIVPRAEKALANAEQAASR